VAGVIGQVVHDLVATGVAVRVARERETGERVIAGGREQLERVPALAPCGRRLVRRLEDRDVAPLAGEEVADRQAGLATADHNHLAALGHGAIGHNSPPSVKPRRDGAVVR
jgi:hypothetical protein